MSPLGALWQPRTDRYGVETCDRQAFLPVLQARQSDVLIWAAA